MCIQTAYDYKTITKKKKKEKIPQPFFPFTGSAKEAGRRMWQIIALAFSGNLHSRDIANLDRQVTFSGISARNSKIFVHWFMAVWVFASVLVFAASAWFFVSQRRCRGEETHLQWVIHGCGCREYRRRASSCLCWAGSPSRRDLPVGDGWLALDSREATELLI